jgi:hypothetical protein
VARRWRGGGAAVAAMFIHCAFVLLFGRYWCIIGAFVGVTGALGCSSAFLCLPLPSSAFLCLSGAEGASVPRLPRFMLIVQRVNILVLEVVLP